MKFSINLIRLFFFAFFIFLVANGKMRLWLAVFAASLIAAVLFGRVYCGYICPMNTLMIPTEWFSKKLGIQTDRTPKWLQSGSFSWILLGIAIVMIILSRRILNINFPFLFIFLVLSVLITLRYKPEVFHNKICPFGALQSVTGRFARFSEKVDDKQCIGCKLCEKVCPSNAIVVSEKDKKAGINPALCHQCLNCQIKCPTDAIRYGRM